MTYQKASKKNKWHVISYPIAISINIHHKKKLRWYPQQLKRFIVTSAGNASAGFPWIKWTQILLNLTWLCTKASQLGLTWLCTKASRIEPSPEPCWTWPGSAPKDPRPSPEPSEPSPEPHWTWPGTCTSAHRSYSGLKTPLAYAVGEKWKSLGTHISDPSYGMTRFSMGWSLEAILPSKSSTKGAIASSSPLSAWKSSISRFLWKWIAILKFLRENDDFRSTVFSDKPMFFQSAEPRMSVLGVSLSNHLPQIEKNNQQPRFGNAPPLPSSLSWPQWTSWWHLCQQQPTAPGRGNKLTPPSTPKPEPPPTLHPPRRFPKGRHPPPWPAASARSSPHPPPRWRGPGVFAPARLSKGLKDLPRLPSPISPFLWHESPISPFLWV